MLFAIIKLSWQFLPHLDKTNNMAGEQYTTALLVLQKPSNHLYRYFLCDKKVFLLFVLQIKFFLENWDQFEQIRSAVQCNELCSFGLSLYLSYGWNYLAYIFFIVEEVSTSVSSRDLGCPRESASSRAHRLLLPPKRLWDFFIYPCIAWPNLSCNFSIVRVGILFCEQIW